MMRSVDYRIGRLERHIAPKREKQLHLVSVLDGKTYVEAIREYADSTGVILSETDLVVFSHIP